MLGAALAADAVLLKARELSGLAQIDHETSVRIIGQIDCNMARFSTKKQKTSLVEFKSVEEVGAAFWMALKDNAGASCPPNPWPHACAQKRDSAALSYQPGSMASHTAHGEFTPEDSNDYLKKQGFSVGCCVISTNKREKPQLSALTV